MPTNAISFINCFEQRNSKTNNINDMALVGKKAPRFIAGAVINGEEIVENFSLDRYIGKKV